MKAKLFAMIAAMLCGVTFTSCDNDDDVISPSVLPDAIQGVFSAKYPNAQIEDFEQKGGYSVVEFRWTDPDAKVLVEAEAWFGTEGWVMTETDIPFDALPNPVQSSFKSSQYADWKIEDVDKVERVNAETVYVIEVERGETEIILHYTSNGILIKDQPDQGGNQQGQSGNDNPYLPEQTPGDIEAKVKAMYPNCRIIETEQDNGNFEVDIIDQNIGKEVVFNAAYEWIYTSWDVHPNALPDVVKTAVKTNYPDYIIDDADFYETPTGNYYDIEIEKGNIEQHIKVSETGTLINGQPGQGEGDNPNQPQQDPIDIKAKVKEMYPDAVISKEPELEDNGNIEVEINDRNIKKEVVFNASYEWIYTSWDVHPNELPDAIKTAVKTNYPDYIIDDADFYETPTGKYYDIEIEKGNIEQHIKVSETGTLINGQPGQGGNQPGQGEGDNPNQPQQDPTDIEAKVKEMYPDAVIIETDRDNGNIEVEIIDRNIKKEVVFNASYEWIYTSWDVALNTLPDAVKTAVKTNYPDYYIDDADFYETPTGNYYDVEIEKGEIDLHIRVSEGGELLK